uniref:Chemokine interleukin-8-like domain-containing protein n=1 Tax=Knipowitschia caucasica TaxID=637954 RepID=A0AAV2JWD1_KNICA
MTIEMFSHSPLRIRTLERGFGCCGLIAAEPLPGDRRGSRVGGQLNTDPLPVPSTPQKQSPKEEERSHRETPRSIVEYKYKRSNSSVRFIMTLRGAVTVATALICLVMVNAGRGKAASGALYCCTRFTRSPVPFHRIRGYKRQSALENCNLDAIIFHTVRNVQICASESDAWVQRVLERLRKKMAKVHQTTETKSPLPVSGTTESSQNFTLFFQ